MIHEATCPRRLHTFPLPEGGEARPLTCPHCGATTEEGRLWLAPTGFHLSEPLANPSDDDGEGRPRPGPVRRFARGLSVARITPVKVVFAVVALLGPMLGIGAAQILGNSRDLGDALASGCFLVVSLCLYVALGVLTLIILVGEIFGARKQSRASLWRFLLGRLVTFLAYMGVIMGFILALVITLFAVCAVGHV